MAQTKISPRQAALEIAHQTLQGQDLQAALHHGLLRFKLSPEDSGLCTNICYNYMRFKGRLEFVLQTLCSKKIASLPPRVRISLGLALFELLYLERIPEYATVYWYVEYCKQKLAPRLAPLVNAVLRRAIREKQGVLQPEFYIQDKPGHSLFLSRYYSCPRWLADLWLKFFGRERCTRLLADSLEPPLIGLRVNQTLPEANQLLELLLQNDSFYKRTGFGLALEKASPDIPSLEEQGLLSRQSLASQQALLQLQPNQWPQPVWDACAGHGGKSTLLLENNIEQLWASDISVLKLKQARQELDRLHLPSIPLFAADISSHPPLKNKPAIVLLDAPCSGLGVLSRRPDIKWKLRKKDLKILARLQSRMLSACLDFLPAKGELCYLTCTLNPGENHEQTYQMLSRPDMHSCQEHPPDLDSGLREYFYAAWLQKK